MRTLATVSTLALLVIGVTGCSGGHRHSAAPATAATAAAKTPASGTLVFLADSCGRTPITTVVPIAVTVRRGTQTVYRQTVTANRDHSLVLSPGTYLVSAPNDFPVSVAIIPGTSTRAHLKNYCK